MGDETLDEYKDRQLRESAAQALIEIGKLKEWKETKNVADAERDVKINSTAKTLSRFTMLCGTLTVTVLGVAIYLLENLPHR